MLNVFEPYYLITTLQVTKLDKYTSKTTSVTPTLHTEDKEEKSTAGIESTSTIDNPMSQSSNISSAIEETVDSSVILQNITASEIVPTSTLSGTPSTTSPTSFYEIHVNSTPTITGNVTHIESSFKDIVQTLKDELSKDVSTLSSTATEKLPETILLVGSTAETNDMMKSSPSITMCEYETFFVIYNSP